MISEFQKLVSGFNKGIGAKKDIELRIKLIDEEVKETADAIDNNQVIEVIDGLCDVLYVTYGAADVMGLELKDGYEDLPPTGKLNWDNTTSQKELFLDVATSAVMFLRENISAVGLQWALQDLSDQCWVLATKGLGIDLRPFFLEVHRTNMHKLNGPVREDGKRLKPPGWKPPRIEAMYNRLVAGNKPACDRSEYCVEVPMDHPQGGFFCPQCGGLVINFLETT